MELLVSNFRPVELEGTFGSVQISKNKFPVEFEGTFGSNYLVCNSKH